MMPLETAEPSVASAKVGPCREHREDCFRARAHVNTCSPRDRHKAACQIRTVGVTEGGYDLLASACFCSRLPLTAHRADRPLLRAIRGHTSGDAALDLAAPRSAILRTTVGAPAAVPSSGFGR